MFSDTRRGVNLRDTGHHGPSASIDGASQWTVRGVADSELPGLTMPVGVLAAVPENPSHQRRTVDTLRQLLPHSQELEGCPEPPLPGFAPHLDRFLAAVITFAAR